MLLPLITCSDKWYLSVSLIPNFDEVTSILSRCIMSMQITLYEIKMMTLRCTLLHFSRSKRDDTFQILQEDGRSKEGSTFGRKGLVSRRFTSSIPLQRRLILIGRLFKCKLIATDDAECNEKKKNTIEWNLFGRREVRNQPATKSYSLAVPQR